MTRDLNWTQNFHNFLKSREAKPFAWGHHDCALFVADAINSFTGTDLGTALRGQYSSLAGAMVKIAIITKKPGATVEDIAEHFALQAGIPERPGHLFAQRGDVVLFDSDNGPAMGVLHLDGKTGLFVAQSGLNQIALKSCRRAWRV